MAKEKVYDFIIELKRPAYILVDTISQLMLLLAVIAITKTLSVSGLNWEIWVVIRTAIVAGIIGWWIYCRFQIKKGKIPYYRLAIVLAAYGWYIQPGGKYIFLVYLLAAILEKQAKFPQEIAFDEEEIVINSFPKKHYQWSAIANVVLKDGILTVDFRNNRLIQKEIETPATESLEAEFNRFCAYRLTQQPAVID